MKRIRKMRDAIIRNRRPTRQQTIEETYELKKYRSGVFLTKVEEKAED